MKLDNLQITIFVSDEGARLEVRDADAVTRFLEIKVAPEKFLAALGRQGCVECAGEVYGLDRVGKKREQQPFEFKVGNTDEVGYGTKKELTRAAALEKCPEGWEPKLYFNSQDSYFTKGDELWARTLMLRWVDKEDAE